MAPPFDAFDTRHLGSKNDLEVYGGEVDPNWSGGWILVGGYALGLIIGACTKYQEKQIANHADPAQLPCQFIASPDIISYEVRIKSLKPGRSYTNLYAEFIQAVRKTELPLNGPWDTTTIPSPYAHRTPLFTDPSIIEAIHEVVANFNGDPRTVVDHAWPKRNSPEVKGSLFEHPKIGDTSEKIGGGGVDEG
ncbi:hypothetical protein BDM02DRAFT_3130940 [Thelephora ganbajun]|uniref:Uncharacterized protein n=1 Tax=Thelephora ganbajun TaxID=370292 RepID=A0ACB6Z7R3_THEGA|nr:hypothetical protein BDM02DRAFT_3130940 [Thelephora ganbajun]